MPTAPANTVSARKKQKDEELPIGDSRNSRSFGLESRFKKRPLAWLERIDMKLIRRDHYMNLLHAVEGSPDIKVITGIRRSGKSKLLEMFTEEVLKTNPYAQVITINFNFSQFRDLENGDALLRYIEDRASSKNPHKDPKEGSNFQKTYICIDEVQMCNGFEKAINSLHATEDYDIYLTGSNAFLQNNDLATLFTGRTFNVSVFPFSLHEFMLYFNLENADAALPSYFEKGGMPGSYMYQEDEIRLRYLNDVFNTLVLRDIEQKHHLRFIDSFARTTDFLMDNISNVTTAKNITAAFKATGLTVSDKTITSYLRYLCDAFAFYKIRRFDTKGLRYLSSGNKYYLADHAFRLARLGRRNLDIGRVYENMVALELMRRGYEVYAGALYKSEIDFIATKFDEKLYLQVCADFSAPETLQREKAPLLKIGDAFPKLILAPTHQETYSYEGIAIHNLATWLKG